MSEEFSGERDSLSYKQLLEQLKVRLDYVWLSAHSPAVSRQELLFQERKWTARSFQDKSRIWRIGGAAFFVPYHVNRFQHLDSNNLFDYLNNSGRYFLSFWGPMKTDSKHQKDYIIDIFDRSTQTKGQYSILCSNYYWTFLQFVAFPSCTASRILCGLCQSWASSCSLILIFLWSR